MLGSSGVWESLGEHVVEPCIVTTFAVFVGLGEEVGYEVGVTG